MASSHVFAGVGGYYGGNQGNLAGVFRRDAAGADWQHVLTEPEAYTVFVHPRDPNLVLAGTKDGIYRSTDGGATFKRADFPDSGVQVWSFLPDPADPKRMLAGGSPASIYRSTDAGESWTRQADPKLPDRGKAPFAVRVMRFARHPRRPDEIYAALEVGGVMRSTDGGESWSDCSEHLIRLSVEEPRLRSKIVSDTEAEGMLDGHAICMSAADPDAVVLAVRMGLFRSQDQGKTWEDLRVDRFSPFTYGRDIKVSPQDPNTLYACLSVAASSKDGALYRSQDIGRTWQRFDKVQPHGTLMSVSLHHADPSRSTSPRATAKCSARRTAARAGAKRRCRRACSTSTRWRAGEIAPRFGAALFILVPEIRLDRAAELDGQRIAVAVLALAGLDADPAFADAIFGDVGFLDALEAHADVALEQLRHRSRGCAGRSKGDRAGCRP